MSTIWNSTSFQQDGVQKDLARAEQLLFEAIESDPNQPMAYAVMGLLRRMQSRLGESRIAFEKAMALDPNFEWANMQLGWTLLFWANQVTRSRMAKKACGSARATRVYSGVMSYWAGASWFRTM